MNHLRIVNMAVSVGLTLFLLSLVAVAVLQ